MIYHVAPQNFCKLTFKKNGEVMKESERTVGWWYRDKHRWTSRTSLMLHDFFRPKRFAAGELDPLSKWNDEVYVRCIQSR